MVDLVGLKFQKELTITAESMCGIIINSPQMLKNNKILGTAMWGKPPLPTANLMRLKWYSRKDIPKHWLNIKITKLTNVRIQNTKIE